MRSDVRRPGLPTWLCVCALLTAGCAPDAAPTSAGGALLPVTLPDLSRIDGPARTQLREQYQLVMQKQASAGTPALELGGAFGAMGKLLMAAKYYDLAEPCLLNAQALDASDRRWPYYLGHLYKAKGELAPAAASFERAIAQGPPDVAALVSLGEVLLVDGRPAAAATQFSKALAVEPRSLAARFGVGRAALAQKDYPGAVAHFEAALALNAQAVSIHYPLAQAYRGLGETAKADAQLRQRGDFEILPADPLMEELLELLESAISYEIRGTRALNGGDWRTAVAQFRQGLALEPSNSTLRHKLGTALYVSGDVRSAQAAFEEVVKESPEYARAHYSLGVLFESDGRPKEAIERFAVAVAHDPGYVEARVRLAGLLRASGRLREAMTHYGQVLTIDPRLAEAAFGQAMVLVSLQRYREARDQLGEAARVHPDEPVFAHALVRLLAAAPDDSVRDGRQALTLMQALPAAQQRLDMGEGMAMALAEAGRYADAAAWQRSAMTAAQAAGNPGLAQRMGGNLRLYQAGRPCRTPWRDEDRP